MIVIRKGDAGNIDFDSPIELTLSERAKFIGFLNTLFYSVKTEEVPTFRPDRLGSKPFSKEWEMEEYEVLLDMENDNSKVSELLGRSWMSVEMKRVYYVDEMLAFAKKKNVNLFKASKAELKALIAEYIKEHEEELSRRKAARTEERREIKQARELIEDYKHREYEIKFLISIGQAKKNALDILKKQKADAEKKLREVKEE